jgi:hypothetical protein
MSDNHNQTDRLQKAHTFSEYFFALFTSENHFCGLRQLVILRLGVAFGAIKPLFTTGIDEACVHSSDGYQHGERMATWTLRICLH